MRASDLSANSRYNENLSASTRVILNGIASLSLPNPNEKIPAHTTERMAIKSIRWSEVILVVVLAGVAGATAYMRASALDPVVYSYGSPKGIRTSDMWFDGDIPKMFTMMTSRSALQHQTTAAHPLISLFVYAPVFSLRHVVGLTTTQAIRVVWAVVAALWAAALFVLLRLVGCRSFDAALFTLLGVASAASVFWFAVPEAFSIGSLLIIVALCLTTLAAPAGSSLPVYVLLNVLTLSVTVTNWMVGILASFLNLHWRRALIAIAVAFLFVSLLWGIEKIAFPQAEFFVGRSAALNFIYFPTPQRMLQVLTSFVSHTIIMPAIQPLDKAPLQRVMTVQQSFPGSGSLAGYVAVAAWLVLLPLGLWACISEARRSRLLQLVLLITAAQLALHLIFGMETFLYSMHFLPLLLIIAASVTLTRFRLPGLALAGIVTISAAINNNLQFVQAVEFLRIMAQIAAAYHGK